MGLSFGPDGSIRDPGGAVIEPLPDACQDPDPKKRPETCPKPQDQTNFDGLPEVELFDRTGAGAWHRLPHLSQGTTYDLADPANYVDPSTGAVLVRFVNDRQDPVSVYLGLSIQGTVR